MNTTFSVDLEEAVFTPEPVVLDENNLVVSPQGLIGRFEFKTSLPSGVHEMHVYMETR